MKRTLALLLLVAACGPIPVDRAERMCVENARLAQQPRGQVGIGIGSDGRVSSNVEVTVSSDFLLNRDPSAVFDRCVLDKSGQLPTRPLTSMPEWSR